jgi:molybdopterin converting factor subunit 1
MTVTVRLFARARDLAGGDVLRLEVPEGVRVGDLRRALAEACPALARLQARCAIALDSDFADDSRPVDPGVEVALLPPVSGGAGPR